MNGSSVFLSSLLAGLAVATAYEPLLERWKTFSDSSAFGLGDLPQRAGISQARFRLAMGVWAVGSGLVCLILALVGAMPVFAVGLAMAFLMIPRWVLRWMARKRTRLLRHQMLAVSTALANVTRSGLSLPQGLREIVQELPEPIRGEIQWLNRYIDRGRTPAEAIGEIRRRLAIDYFDIFASVMLTCNETGANYCMALERLGHSIQENERLERKLEADTAAGRSVVVTLALFPVGFLGFVHLTVPQNTEQVFASYGGQVVLVICGLMTYLSVRYAIRIMNIQI